MTKTVSIQDAEGHLDELIDLATRGEDIVIAKNDQAQARLVPVRARKRTKRRFGRYQAKLWISDDFDARLPEAFSLATTGTNP